jgi:hypothetical protein
MFPKLAVAGVSDPSGTPISAGAAVPAPFLKAQVAGHLLNV